MEFFANYITTAAIFAIIDALWVRSTKKALHASALAKSLRAERNVVNATIFRLLFPLGLTIFALNPGLGQGSWTYVLAHSALYGFLVYSLHNLANRTILKNWTVKIALISTDYGTKTSIVTALAAYFILT